MSRKFTGIHMFAILVAFFGTVMAVNFTMASLATSTFGGVTVKNSYVASQKFNSWLDQAAEQDALGWEVATSWRDDGHLVVSATGPGTRAHLSAHARHPLGREADREIAFERSDSGAFVSTRPLPSDRWIVRLHLTDGSDDWRREDRL